MKRNDQERIERELARVKKRAEIGERRAAGADDRSVGSYIKSLAALLRHDDEVVYNTLDDEAILELLETMKDDLPEKDWEKVIRRAVSLTKVAQKETAVTELRSLIGV
jgi:hypothetical protein